MKTLKVKITTFEEMLGMMPSNPDVVREHIASMAPDAPSMEEEVASIGVDAAMANAMTVFPRMDDGKPFFWDYQMKGMIKDLINAVREDTEPATSKNKKLSKWGYKRTIDNCLHVTPRKIPIIIPEGAVFGKCERPLRTEFKGVERTALAISETIPAGAVIVLEFHCVFPELEKSIREVLDFGKFKGLGQWRNSGKGRFTWEEIKE